MIPKPERSTENSAELSLALVRNPSSAGPAPNLVTVRVNYYFLSTMSASNTEVHCCTPYTAQNSLCALKMSLCCAHCSQEGAGIGGTSPQKKRLQSCGGGSCFRGSTCVQVEEEQGRSSQQICCLGTGQREVMCAWPVWCQAKLAAHRGLSTWAWRQHHV